MAGKSEYQFSRRERQIMDVVYARGQATVAGVHRALPDRPSYSAVRALMRILEDKGHLRHRAEGNRYVYLPTRPRCQAGQSALRRLVVTFFDGSAAAAIAALLESSDLPPSQPELDRLAELIEKTRKEGR